MYKSILKQILAITLAIALLIAPFPAMTLPAAAETAGDIGDQNALDALGIDTSLMPEGYDANSLENPYGRSTLTLNPVHELFETRTTVSSSSIDRKTETSDDGTVTRTDTETTPHTVAMSLYGHNKPLGDIQ